jgi:hypothetical protein
LVKQLSRIVSYRNEGSSEASELTSAFGGLMSGAGYYNAAGQTGKAKLEANFGSG